VASDAATYARVSGPYQSPNLPAFVFSFSFGKTIGRGRCVYVRTLYSGGFSDSRGGNGEVWMVVKLLSGQWTVKDKGTWYAAD
jgi:hypothetical protein